MPQPITNVLAQSKALIQQNRLITILLSLSILLTGSTVTGYAMYQKSRVKITKKITTTPSKILTPTVLPTSTLTPTKSPTPIPTNLPTSTPTNTPKVETAPVITNVSGVIDGTITESNCTISVSYKATNTSNSLYMRYKLDAQNWIGWRNIYEFCLPEAFTLGNHSFSVQIEEFSNINGKYYESAVVTKNYRVEDKQAPELVEWTGPENGSTTTFTNFCFPAHYTDNFSGNNPIQIRFQFNGGNWSDWGADSGFCFNKVVNGSYTLAIQARDKAGNESVVSNRSFTVDAPTP